MDREWKTKRQKLTLFSYESKTLLSFLQVLDAFIVFRQTGSIIILHSSFFTLHFFLVSSSAQSVVEVHDSLHLVEVVSNL